MNKLIPVPFTATGPYLILIFPIDDKLLTAVKEKSSWKLELLREW